MEQKEKRRKGKGLDCQRAGTLEATISAIPVWPRVWGFPLRLRIGWSATPDTPFFPFSNVASSFPPDRSEFDRDVSPLLFVFAMIGDNDGNNH